MVITVAAFGVISFTVILVAVVIDLVCVVKGLSAGRTRKLTIPRNRGVWGYLKAAPQPTERKTALLSSPHLQEEYQHEYQEMMPLREGSLRVALGPHESEDDTGLDDYKKEGGGINRGDEPHINYLIVSHRLPDLKDTSIPPALEANVQ